MGQLFLIILLDIIFMLVLQQLLETEEKVAKLDNSTPKPEDHDSAAAASPNPLEKYMKMMQQNLVQDPACKVTFFSVCG